MSARAQFDDTVSVVKEADARGKLPPYLQQPLADLLKTLGINNSARSGRSLRGESACCQRSSAKTMNARPPAMATYWRPSTANDIGLERTGPPVWNCHNA